MKIGDVVQAKSGGPLVTVCATNDFKSIQIMWFDSDNQLHTPKEWFSKNLFNKHIKEIEYKDKLEEVLCAMDGGIFFTYYPEDSEIIKYLIDEGLLLHSSTESGKFTITDKGRKEAFIAHNAWRKRAGLHYFEEVGGPLIKSSQ